MSSSMAVFRGAATALVAALAASVLMLAPAYAADPAPGDSAQVTLPPAPAVAPAAAPTAARPARVKAPRPAEKSYEELRAIDGPWARRTNWLAFRAGYAKASGQAAGDGLVGYGIAYQRMLTSRYSFGGAVQHDLLGHLGSSYEISVPFTLELARHFRWNTALRPYVGLGAGYYFHKYKRTAGQDTGSPGRGVHVSVGTNLPLDDRHLLGLDTRVSFVRTTEGVVNPVFGTQKASETLWSVKLGWAMTY